MGRRYLSVIDARTKGSLCKFQLPTVPGFPVPDVPGIPPIPTLPKMPTINLFCPFDDADEEVPTT